MKRGDEDDEENEFDLEDLELPEPDIKYKEARLADCNGDVSKRWFIVFYVYDKSIGDLVRKRFSGNINKIKTASRRYKLAYKYIREINRLLESGYTTLKEEDPDEKKPLKNTGLKSYSIIEALDWTYNKKILTVRANSARWYRTVKDDFSLFLKNNGLAKAKIKKLDVNIIYAYQDHLKSKDITNRTINNYMTNLTALINYMMKRDPKLLKNNPAESIDRLPVEKSKKHSVYSPEQLKAIRKELKKDEKNHQLLLYINFIFYTLARPNEILQMKISHIEMDQDRIYIPASSSKNRMGDYINLFTPLKNIIL